MLMQNDCNLVIYPSNGTIWSSQTYGRGNTCQAHLHDDGNFVVYNATQAVWSSFRNAPL